MPRHTSQLAKAIRRAQNRSIAYKNRAPVYGQVLSVNPTTVELHDSAIVLDDDILIWPYDTDGLKANDTVVVQEMSDGDWVVLNVLSDTFLVSGAPSGGRKVAQLLGNGSATTFLIAHPFHTRDLSVSVQETTTPFREIDATKSFPDLGHVQVEFLLAPAPDTYRVVILSV